MDDKPEEQNQQAPQKAYGKMSKKQWVILYVVGAVIVYGLVYFLFIRESGSTGFNY